MYSSRRSSLLSGGLNYSLLLTLSTLLFLYHLQRTSTLFSSTLHDAASPQPLPIPKIIWHKLDSQGFTPALLERTTTCMSANPDHDIEFISDDDAVDFVSTAEAGWRCADYVQMFVCYVWGLGGDDEEELGMPTLATLHA